METIEVPRFLVDLAISIGLLSFTLLGLTISLRVSEDRKYWVGMLFGGIAGVLLMILSRI